MKLTVTKEFTWDCAHMLTNHKGLCKNVHGHTYKMLVEVAHFGPSNVYTSQSPEKEGMVVDFKMLKQKVQERLISKLDHAFITWDEGGEAEKDVVAVLKKHGLKVYHMEDRPTAENMAKHFFAVLQQYFKGTEIVIMSVTVYETPTSFAKFSN